MGGTGNFRADFSIISISVVYATLHTVQMKDLFFCSLHCQEHPKNSTFVAFPRRFFGGWFGTRNCGMHFGRTRRGIFELRRCNLLFPQLLLLFLQELVKNQYILLSQKMLKIPATLQLLFYLTSSTFIPFVFLSLASIPPSTLKKKKTSDEESLPSIAVGTIAANDAAQTRLDARLISTNCTIGLRGPRMAVGFMSYKFNFNRAVLKTKLWESTCTGSGWLVN